MGNYSKFIIELVAMLYRQPEEKRVFSDEELEDLQVHFKTAVSESLTEDGGTDVHDTIGALNVAIYTKITGAGLGGAAMEGDVVDSMTGEQIAAASRWGSVCSMS